jgi:hypothetical protein
MSQTVAVPERTQEFVNSLLFSAPAADPKSRNASRAQRELRNRQPFSRSAGRDYYERGAQSGGGLPTGARFPCRTARILSSMRGWLLLSKRAVSEQRLWEGLSEIPLRAPVTKRT